MNDNIFRKKSIEKISSPEDLDKYIKTVNPGVWMLVISITIFIIAAFVLAHYGKIDVSVETYAVVKDGNATCYIKDENADEVRNSKKIVINNTEYDITVVETFPVRVDEKIDDYIVYSENFNYGEWVYTLRAKTPIKDGVYKAGIITESINPLSFIIAG